jgi:putative FmdB family regulatory protein
MPTYEYECGKCGHQFELFQSMTESPRKRCPKCRGAVRRLLGTGAGVLFKGSGFYETDYRSDSYKKAAKSETSAGKADKKTAGKEGAKASSKSDAKTESKTESKPATTNS